MPSSAIRRLVPCTLAVCGWVSCVDKPAQPPTMPTASPAPPVAATAEADAGVPAAAPEEKREVRFEPVPLAVSREPSPHVEILFPFAEQSLAVAKAARYKVRLKVENWPVGEDGRGVDLVLDDFRPRRLKTLDPPIELGELVPENAELGAGEHTLVAMAVREDGAIVRPPRATSLAPFALVRFWIGQRGAGASPSAARLIYVRPRGTINGEAAAERVLLDFLPIGADLGRGKSSVVVRISGRFAVGSTVLESWQPLHILDLPSGDHEVTVELVGPDGRPSDDPRSRARRTITVNRDAPVAVP